jgi:hypothetical protein
MRASGSCLVGLRRKGAIGSADYEKCPKYMADCGLAEIHCHNVAGRMALVFVTKGETALPMLVIRAGEVGA